ncbi:MAG TPA: c-type cytochrome [Sulfuricella sp.]|nr:c-type cytochrome [Sulfuricella sp.]
MKVVLGIAAAAALLVAGQSMAANAPAPKEAATCLACHDVDVKKIGPAYKDVAKKFAGDKGAEAKLVEQVLKGTGPNGVGWMKEGKASMPFMPANAVKPEDAKKIVEWILKLK